MSLAWARRIAPGALWLCAACGGASSGATAAPSADGGTGASGNAPGVTFAFDPSLACSGGGLCVHPSQAITVTAQISGPDTGLDVSLEGDYEDASLSVNRLRTSGGSASFVLHTSSAATTFTLSARPDGATDTTLAVAVSASGFATIAATPTYTGHRAATAFYASAFSHSTCAMLAKTPSTDPFGWTQGAPGQALTLVVPAGQPVAVDVRVGHYAFGCVDLPALDPQSTSSQSIAVYDAPMALDKTDLNATFSFQLAQGDVASWGSMVTSASSQVASQFFAKPSQAGTLLDWMRGTIAQSSDQTAYDAAREQSGWDQKATTWLSARAPSIHDRATAWLDAVAYDPIGDLTMHLSAGAKSGTAAVTLASFGAFDATTAGFTPPMPFTWSADPDDTVHLAGTLGLSSSTLVARGADAHARHDAPSANDVPSALALAIDCTGLAQNLVGSGVSYGACDAACTADACRAALGVAWTSASPANSATPSGVGISIAASAPALVGDSAEPLHFGGSWLGQVSASTGMFTAKGSVEGDKPSVAK